MKLLTGLDGSLPKVEYVFRIKTLPETTAEAMDLAQLVFDRIHRDHSFGGEGKKQFSFDYQLPQSVSNLHSDTTKQIISGVRPAVLEELAFIFSDKYASSLAQNQLANGGAAPLEGESPLTIGLHNLNFYARVSPVHEYSEAYVLREPLLKLQRMMNSLVQVLLPRSFGDSQNSLKIKQRALGIEVCRTKDRKYVVALGYFSRKS